MTQPAKRRGRPRANPEAAPNNLAAIRERRGLTQPELAEALGMTVLHLGRLERGERRLTEHWLRQAAKALGCEPRDIVQNTMELSDMERRIVTAFRAMGESQKQLLERLLSEMQPADPKQ